MPASVFTIEAMTTDITEGGAAGTVRIHRASAAGDTGDGWVFLQGSGTADPGSDVRVNGNVSPSGMWTYLNVLPGGYLDVPVSAPDDGQAEGDETITLGVVRYYPEDSVGTPAAATITIHDPPPAVSVVAVGYAVEGGQDGTFRFTRTGGLELPLTATYTVETEGSRVATPGDDYAPLTGSVTFPAGSGMEDVSVDAFRDNQVEVTEAVSITIDPAATYEIGAGTAYVDIFDATPVVSVSKVNDAVEGGIDGMFRFTRTGDTYLPLTVSYAVGTTGMGAAATAGDDYTPLGGVVTIPAWSDSVVVPVIALLDGLVEPDEMVTVVIDAGNGYALGADTATVTVIDDTPTVTVGKLADTTENATPGAFRFARDKGLSRALTVRYAIDDHDDDFIATPGLDYQNIGSEGFPGFVTFTPGEATADLAIATISDNEIEETEQVILTLSAPDIATDLYATTATDPVIVSIVDDPPVVSYTAEWFSTGGTIGYATLTRSGGNIHEPLTVWFEPEGTAEIDGETVRVVMAATAVIPAESGTLVVPIISETIGVGVFQHPDAERPASRAAC